MKHTCILRKNLYSAIGNIKSSHRGMASFTIHLHTTKAATHFGPNYLRPHCLGRQSPSSCGWSSLGGVFLCLYKDSRSSRRGSAERCLTWALQISPSVRPQDSPPWKQVAALPAPPQRAPGNCPWCWRPPRRPECGTICGRAATTSSARSRSSCRPPAGTDWRLSSNGGNRSGSWEALTWRPCLEETGRMGWDIKSHAEEMTRKLCCFSTFCEGFYNLQVCIFWRFLRWFTVSSRMSAFSSLRFRICVKKNVY